MFWYTGYRSGGDYTLMCVKIQNTLIIPMKKWIIKSVNEIEISILSNKNLIGCHRQFIINSDTMEIGWVYIILHTSDIGGKVVPIFYPITRNYVINIFL